MTDTRHSATTLPILRSVPTVDALSRLLESTYTLTNVRCQLIKGTIRDTYLVESLNTRRIFTLYRHAQRTPAEITAELDLIDFLHTNDLPVAPAIPTRTGDRILPIQSPEGIRYGVLFTYIPGHHLDRRPEPDLAHRYGATIARLHTLADAYPSPLPRPPIGIPTMIDHPLAAFASVVTHRPADISCLNQVATHLTHHLVQLPKHPPAFGLIHGDVIPSNAQITPDGTLTLLDFDFCGSGWRAYDIATYLSEIRFWNASPTAAEAFLTGYETIRPLLPWEHQSLPLFEATRHLFSLGIPALHVNEWGSSYLSDPLINTLLSVIRQCLKDAAASEEADDPSCA